MKLTTYIDKNNKMWLCKIEPVTSDIATGGTTVCAQRNGKKYITLPSGIIDTNFKQGLTFTYYNLNGCCLFGNATLDMLILPEAVERIGDYAFKGSKIRHLVFQTPLPPEITSYSFEEMGLTADNPLILEVFKGYRDIFLSSFRAQIGKHLENKTIEIIENSTVLSLLDIIPSFYEAGEMIGGIEFGTQPTKIGDMAFLGHIADPEVNNSKTSISGITSDTTPYALDTDYVAVYSTTGEDAGYVFQGANQIMPNIINKSININAFYRRNQVNNDPTTVTFTGERLDSFAFQNNEKISTLQINLSKLVSIAPDALYKLKNLTAVQVKNYTDASVVIPYFWDDSSNSKGWKEIEKDQTNYSSAQALFIIQNNKLMLIWQSSQLTIEQYNALLCVTVTNAEGKTLSLNQILPNSCLNLTIGDEEQPNTTLSIPSNIKEIGTNAFYGVTTIKEVEFKTSQARTVAEKINVGSGAFGGLNEIAVIGGDNVTGENIYINTKTTELVTPTTINDLKQALLSPNDCVIRLTGLSDITNNTIITITPWDLDDINTNIGQKIIEAGNQINIGLRFVGFPNKLTFRNTNGETKQFGPLMFQGMGNNTVTLQNCDIFGFWNSQKTEPHQTCAITAYDSLTLYVNGLCRVMAGPDGDGIRALSGHLSIIGEGETSKLGAFGSARYETLDFNVGLSDFLTYTSPYTDNIASTWLIDFQKEISSSITFNEENDYSFFGMANNEADPCHDFKYIKDFQSSPPASGCGGSGIGYSKAQNDSDDQALIGNITITNLSYLRAEGYGKHGFGIGGGQHDNQCHSLINCRNIILKGGYNIPFNTRPDSPGTVPEGGPGFGVGIKTLHPTQKYSGTIIVQNCHIKAAYGGMKSSAIGSCLGSGVKILWTDSKCEYAIGGAYGAGIGTGMMWTLGHQYSGNPCAYINMQFTNAFQLAPQQKQCIYGGWFGAAIGTGGTDRTYDHPDRDTQIYITSTQSTSLGFELYGGTNAAAIGTGAQVGGHIKCNIVTPADFTVSTAVIDYTTNNTNFDKKKYLDSWSNSSGSITLSPETNIWVYNTMPAWSAQPTGNKPTGEGEVRQCYYRQFTQNKKQDSTKISGFNTISFLTDFNPLINNVYTSYTPIQQWEENLFKTVPQLIGYGSGYIGDGYSADGIYQNSKRSATESPLYSYQHNKLNQDIIINGVIMPGLSQFQPVPNGSKQVIYTADILFVL